LGDQIKDNEIDQACGTYGRQERCMQGFDGETRGKENTWKIDVDGRIIFKLIFKKWNGKA
jgi:hypothetical protein